MSTESPPSAPPQPLRGDAAGRGWKRELAEAIRDPATLCRALDLDPALVPAAATAAVGFPLIVPRPFLARMRRGDPRDPLLLQVLPQAAEGVERPGWVADPLREAGAMQAKALVRKYDGRALLLATGACAVHCRYCFRRAFPYAEHGTGSGGIEAALGAIAADPSIREVILSGGDPLLLDDDRLGDLIGRLAAIPTVTRLRIHTRLPIVIPSRVTGELVELLAAARMRPVIVIHANHPAEIDAEVAAALGRLATAGALLLNQAVLLAGVNDTLAAQIGLAERLVDAGVLPYYLHLPDRVAGTAHFDVSEETARGLLDSLRAALPGYAIPRLVREVPGELSKVPLL